LQTYYSNQANDHTDEFLEFGRIASQLKVISENVNLTSESRILDFGCGQGHLLNAFHTKFDISKERLIGFDVNDAIVGENFSFYADLKKITGKFDLIIFSHTLEHILSFDILTTLKEFLLANGTLYIEIPDAQNYRSFPRSTPAYYLDRPHINHFSPKSLFKLLDKYSLKILSMVQSSFTYIDGDSYPALCVFTALTPEKNFIELEIDSGFAAARNLGLLNLENAKVVIWGAGDNFFRLDNFGAFENLNIVALCDASKVGQIIGLYPMVSTIDEALKNYPSATYLISITWGKGELEKFIKSMASESVVIQI